MSDLEKLQRVLWCAVMFICLAFFCFAVTVTVLERMPEEPAIVTVVYEPAEISKPKMQAAMPIPATETATAGLDPMIEDTYLRDDIPLSYELQALLYGACKEFGIDYPLALAMIEQETQFKNIMGDGGKAYGYFQVWIKWHEDRMAQLGVSDLMDPEGNFRVALHFMRENLDKYGSLEDALSFYNTGAPGQTRYSRDVMERMQKYDG